MGCFNRLEALFYHLIRDICNDGRQLIKVLPKKAESSMNKELKNLYREHLEETDDFTLRKSDEYVLDVVMGQHFPHQDLRLNPIIFELFEYSPTETKHRISTG